MKAVSWLIMVSFLTIIVVPGEAVAALPPVALKDSSGSGRDFSEFGSPTESSVGDGKYGQGVRFADAGQALYARGDAFQVTGNLSAFVRVKFDTLDSGVTQTVFRFGKAATESESYNILYALFPRAVSPFGRIQYTHEFGAGTDAEIFSDGPVLTAGVIHSISLRRDVSQKRILVSVDGVGVVNKTYTTGPTGGLGGSTFDVGGATNIGESSAVVGLKGVIYEVRLWDSLIPNATLNRLADPNDNFAVQSPLGNELALYFLEHPCADGQDQLSVTIGLIPVILILGIFVALTLGIIKGRE